MIKPSRMPSASFLNEAASSPAAQRAGAAPGAHQQGKAERQPAAETSFDRAMKHALAQRSGKPAVAAARATAPPLERGGSADTAAPARKPTGKQPGPDGGAAPSPGADSALAARKPGPESASGPSTAAAPNPAAAAATAGAAGQSFGNSLGNNADNSIGPGAGAPGSSAWGGATAQLQTTFNGARLHPAAQGGAIASAHAALNRALAGGANSAHTAAPASTKSGDTDLGGATPLPRPLPPATADVAPDLLQATPTPSPTLTLTPAPPAATASAADRTAMTAASASPGDPASAASRASAPSGAQVRARSTAISSASEPATEAAKAERATAGERPVVDQSQAAAGDRHDHQRPPGAEALPRASNRAADRGADRAAVLGASRAGTALRGRDVTDSDLRPAPALALVLAPATTVPATASDVPNANANAAPAHGATGSAALSPAPPEANAAGALPAHIDSPVSSATFAAEAGYRIAVLVREGIESAQLQLNPAEMGPVTVQIVVEGLTAQVHLAAAHADTRQALEAAMPQLASSLRESGLTLTGGGVSDQPPRQQGSLQDGGTGNERGGRNGAGSDSGNSSPDAQRAAHTGRGGSAGPRRGVVDLVA